MVAAVSDEIHHQGVVADAELAEAPQAGARIHQVVEEHPALRDRGSPPGKLGRIGLSTAAIMSSVTRGRPSCHRSSSRDHPCRRRCVGRNDVVGPFAGVAHGFGQVMVEGEVGAGDVGRVGGDVAVADLDLAIPHVLGMDELDVVDEVGSSFNSTAHTRPSKSLRVTRRNFGSVWGVSFLGFRVCFAH